jgi:hypothetical protein
MAQSRDPIASNDVQAHPLLPPPLLRHQTTLLVCSLAFRKYVAVNHVLRNRLPPHINIVLDGVHPTLLLHLIQGWVYPLLTWPPLRYMLLHHPIGHANMKPLEPCQSGRAQDPRLTLTRGGTFSLPSTCPMGVNCLDVSTRLILSRRSTISSSHLFRGSPKSIFRSLRTRGMQPTVQATQAAQRSSTPIALGGGVYIPMQ